MEFGLVALWLVVYLALLFAGLPLAAALFPRLADRGAGVAIPLSAALIWLVGYWLGHLSLSLALWVGVLLLGGLAVATSYLRDIEFDRRAVAETAGVFTVAFLFLVAIRAVDPAVHPLGGEKFLDFGLLKSILRTGKVPPLDFWFAGEPVSYYYGGHLLAALLTKLTGTAPAYAYNLALSGFYAMFVTAAYGLAGSITAERGSPRWLGGLFAAFFVGFAANLSTAGKVVLYLLPDGLATTVAGFSSFEADGVVDSLAAFSYWSASRVIDGTVNEFPLFAWLNGDLHAHMMSTPFMLLTAAVLYSYYRTPADEVFRRRLLVFGALPPLAGLLAVVNTWSFPSVGGLTLLSLGLAPTDPATLVPTSLGERLRASGSVARDELARLGTAAGAAVVVVLLGLLWSAPFWLGTASTRSIGFFPERSPMGPLLVVHGTFLLVFVPYLLRHTLPRLTNGGKVGVMVLLVVLLSWLSQAPAVAVLAPIIAVAWGLARFADTSLDGFEAPDPTAATADGGTTPEDAGSDGWLPTPSYEMVLLIAGAGLVLLVEFVFVVEEAGPGRFNTVFKTYAQVWALWAVAAGAMATHLVWQHRPDLALSGGRWRQANYAFAALLVVSASMYGVFALSDHVTNQSVTAQTDGPTLNATRFVALQHAEEASAINWLDTRVEGQPTVVSAPGGYQWAPAEGKGSNAPSSLTGIPTVIGWYHEIGYRGVGPYRERKADVRTIYTGSPEAQARLLGQYDVQYIYVGPAERAKYGDPTFAGVPGVSVAKQWPEVIIYRVDQSALGDGQ
jgi:YYY domain-containing protein